MPNFLWVCVGGAIGTGARSLVSGWLQNPGSGYPFGTLAVNLVGSFLIAAVMHASSATELIPPAARVVLTTGVLGGFTTYSAFSFETLQLLQGGSWRLAAVHSAATLFGCLAACYLGFLASRWACGP